MTSAIVRTLPNFEEITFHPGAAD